MKRVSLVLALAALVCLLGVPFAVFTGCTPPEPESNITKAATTARTQKKVDVEYNISTNVITVRPDTVRISKQAQEEVDWHCLDGDVEIRFTDKTPFVSGAFHIAKGGGASSGLARSDAKYGYKYSVILTIPGRDANDQPKPLDPEVVVDP